MRYDVLLLKLQGRALQRRSPRCDSLEVNNSVTYCIQYPTISQRVLAADQTGINGMTHNSDCRLLSRYRISSTRH